jgi:hypothetical protein
MDCVEFGLFAADDPVDQSFTCSICWSRIYEYPYVLDRIVGESVHNVAWGFEGIHVVFKERLDALYDDVMHSDLRGSHLPATSVWDMRTPPPPEWLGRFDSVLCISTLEHVAGDHAGIIRDNLLSQVAPGGRLIVTFDWPGFQLGPVEEMVGRRLAIPEHPLSPRSSLEPDTVLGLDDGLRVGFLVVEVP